MLGNYSMHDLFFIALEHQMESHGKKYFSTETQGRWIILSFGNSGDARHLPSLPPLFS